MINQERRWWWISGRIRFKSFKKTDKHVGRRVRREESSPIYWWELWCQTNETKNWLLISMLVIISHWGSAPTETECGAQTGGRLPVPCAQVSRTGLTRRPILDLFSLRFFSENFVYPINCRLEWLEPLECNWMQHDQFPSGSSANTINKMTDWITFPTIR